MSKIIHGDCFKELPKLKAESIDFVCFSPPYDALRSYKGFPTLDLHKLGEELFRVAKPGAICAMVIQDETKRGKKSLTSFRTALDWCDTIGWKLFDCLIYQREGIPGKRPGFRCEHEYIHLFLKGSKPKHLDKSHLTIPCKTSGATGLKFTRKKQGVCYNPGSFTVGDTRERGSVWKYQASCYEGNRLKLRHPATYPDALASDLIRCFAAEGDTVLDPMAGSGTTCVECLKWRRRYIGIEYSQVYCDIIHKRLAFEVIPDIFEEFADTEVA
jgi:DNA modification methylase